MATTYSGDLGIKVYTAIAVKHGLIMYHMTGMKPNRSWTPKAMMLKAMDITGKTIKPRDYLRAIDELEEWIQINGPIAQKNGDIK